MDQPVGLSFLGGFLVIVAAGGVAGLLARVVRATRLSRTLVDMGLGALGGFVVIFVLPMNGVALGHVIGWPAALALGALLPVAVLHLLVPSRPRRRGTPPPG